MRYVDQYFHVVYLVRTYLIYEMKVGILFESVVFGVNILRRADSVN